MSTAEKPVLPLTVYYDRSCPLCATEMHALRRLNPGALNLVDCSARNFDDRAIACTGVTRDALMKHIHARGPDGRWLVGLDAFGAAYAAAGLKGAARLWGSRRLRPVLDRIYPWIARYRQPLSRLGLHRVVGALLGAQADARAKNADV